MYIYRKDELKQETGHSISASQGFLIDQQMWNKIADYRCLKPNLKESSDMWPHYDIEGFRGAKSKEELEKVKVLPFNKYFMNLEDPKIWEDMTDGDKGIGLWKETYGFDFVAFVPGKDGATDDYACEDYCLREEFGDFAKKCKEKNGLFKCCKMSLRLDNYEASKAKKCNKHFNDGSNCFICTATRVCTYKVQSLP